MKVGCCPLTIYTRFHSYFKKTASNVSFYVAKFSLLSVEIGVSKGFCFLCPKFVKFFFLYYSKRNLNLHNPESKKDA